MAHPCNTTPDSQYTHGHQEWLDIRLQTAATTITTSPMRVLICPSCRWKSMIWNCALNHKESRVYFKHISGINGWNVSKHKKRLKELELAIALHPWWHLVIWCDGQTRIALYLNISGIVPQWEQDNALVTLATCCASWMLLDVVGCHWTLLTVIGWWHWCKQVSHPHIPCPGRMHT